MIKLTPQQVFDNAVSGVLAQGKQSMDEDGCAYRAPDGCKCAAGHVLPDDLYNPEMEGSGVYFGMAGDAFSGFCTTEAMDVLDSLQQAHDSKYNWRNGTTSMAEEFQRIAHFYDLNDDACLPYLT